jgi:hypothetical protein
MPRFNLTGFEEVAVLQTDDLFLGALDSSEEGNSGKW